MLSFEKEARAELLVKDVKKKKGIYHVQEKTVPGILHENPMSLLSRSRLYTLKRKYGLSKTFVNVLSKSYQQKKEFMTPVSKNLNESVAVQEIEAELLDRMKYSFQDTSYDFVPHMDFTKSDITQMSCTFVSGSSSGKSFLASRFLLENITTPRKRKVYVICANPKRDRPWLDFKKEYKKLGGDCILIDAHDLIEEVPLDSLTPGCCLVVDDEEVLDHGGVIQRLQRKALIEGRKYSAPGVGGIVLFSVKHSLHNGAASKWHATESSGFVLFTKSNQTLCRKILKSKLHFGKKMIDRIIELGGKGRYSWVYIRTGYAPTFVCSSSGIFLL